MYNKRLLNLTIALIIFLGIPFIFGTGWILLSWVPAILAVLYLDDELRESISKLIN
jgi:hypothetical protein